MDRETAITYSRKITQTSPTGLVVITYELMERYMDEAMEMHDHDTIRYREAIKKTRGLLGELISSLDLQYEVGGQLLRIYLYLNKALLQADYRNDASLLLRLRGIVTKLKEAFAEVAKTDSHGPVMENTEKVYAGLTYSRTSLNEDVSGNPNRGFLA